MRGLKHGREEKLEYSKYPPRAASAGLMRLFWFAPMMFLAGLLIRQGYSLPAGYGKAEMDMHTPSAAETRAPLPTTAATLPPPTPMPTPTLRPTPMPEVVLAHLSAYWPPFGNINCDYECAHIANGDRWQQWVGKGVACPSRYPLGTVFLIMGEKWQCVDRGEAIVVNSDGSIWLDLLLPKMPAGVAWGSLQLVEVHRR